MTNLHLNQELIRRVDGARFFGRFDLRAEATGYAFVDCRDSNLQYCDSCNQCQLFDDVVDQGRALEERLSFALSCEEETLAHNTSLSSLNDELRHQLHLSHTELVGSRARVLTLETENAALSAQLESSRTLAIALEMELLELRSTRTVPQVPFYLQSCKNEV